MSGKFPGLVEYFARAAESAINKNNVPQWIQSKFQSNNVPQLAKLQVAILIMNRTRFELRRHTADLESGKWNTSNPWILTAPEIIKSNEERWIVAENNNFLGTIKGKIGYLTQGLSGQGFMVEFKNPTVGENEFTFTKSIGEMTKDTGYGGTGNRAFVAFDIQPS